MASVEISEKAGVRQLHLGSALIQGAMRIARPWALELEYTREMMAPLALRANAPWPARVLQVGLGSASITRFLMRHRPEAKLTVVEIMPEVVACARQYFKLPEESAQLEIVIGDGFEFMASTRRRFDFIVVDGFDGEARAGMLDTAPFYHNVRERLTSRGMMAVNMLHRRGSVAESIRRIHEAFGERMLVLPASEAGNTVALGATGAAIRLSGKDLSAAVFKLKDATGLDLRPTIARLVKERGNGSLAL
jgi:spermidine synthase